MRRRANCRPSSVCQKRRATAPARRYHTPYGATEALPVAYDFRREVLEQTAERTRTGAGTCVGHAFPGVTIKIIEITDAPIATLSTARELPAGQIGEIIVQGPSVTRSYLRDRWPRPKPKSPTRPKTTIPTRAESRSGIAWGTSAISTTRGGSGTAAESRTSSTRAKGSLFTEPCEAIFNEHPRVSRSALVGVRTGPGRRSNSRDHCRARERQFPLRDADRQKFAAELRDLAAANPLTLDIHTVLFHRSLPVDVRHNSKINRERLRGRPTRCRAAGEAAAAARPAMNALVTGGAGFLGLYLTEQLVARGDRVRVLSRRSHPRLAELGVEWQEGDVRDPHAVDRACRNIDTVFHAAAIPGIWGPWKHFYETNTLGTLHVLDACRKDRVARLIYTSSPSVIYDGADHLNVDESHPYPSHYLCHYPHTKALAEKAVLAANGSDGLATVALRPHLIWGPRDTHLVPRLIERARSGRLRRVGDGNNLISMTYVENAAAAHLQAADALYPGSPPAGNAYFINELAAGQPLGLDRRAPGPRRPAARPQIDFGPSRLRRRGNLAKRSTGSAHFCRAADDAVPRPAAQRLALLPDRPCPARLRLQAPRDGRGGHAPPGA